MKKQELDLKNVMENMEELVTFASYQSDYSQLKILSIETEEQARQTDQLTAAKVIPISRAKARRQVHSSARHKSLRFFDKAAQ